VLTWEKRLLRARAFLAKQSARVLELRERNLIRKEGKKQTKERYEANSAAKVSQSSWLSRIAIKSEQSEAKVPEVSPIEIMHSIAYNKELNSA